MVDGLVGTNLRAAAALDALVLVDLRTFIHKRYGIFGADLVAGMGQAALAGAGHAIDVVGTGIAGKADDVDERRLIVGIGDGGLLESLRHACGAAHALKRHAHSQAHALAHDGALEEDALAVGTHVTRANIVGNLIKQVVEWHLLVARGVAKLIEDARDFLENLATDARDVGIDASHGIGHGFLPGPWTRNA